ncbi:hypothetical protein P2W49_11830 [Yersinia intermedia]|nr:hypothetical protein P2W49_11830 [Yersinia intermedia]
MATTPTQNPVPSESPRDLKFNAGKIDEFVTSFVLTYTDRLGRDHLTIEGLKDLIERAIKAFGFVTMDSFEDGATLDNSSQVLRWESNGEYYRWDGSFPKVVPAASTPETSGGVGIGAWLSIGDAALRSNLSSDADGEGDSLVAVKQPFAGSITRTQHLRNAETLRATDWGAVGDGITNDDAAFTLLEADVTGKYIDLCGLTYSVTAAFTGNKYGNGVFKRADGQLIPALYHSTQARSGRYFQAMGQDALHSMPELPNGSFGTNLIAIGPRSLYKAINVKNVYAFGYQALYNLENGIYNSAFGFESMFYTNGDGDGITGSRNAAFGDNTMRFNTTGYNNIAFGRNAAQTNVTGSNNVNLGIASGAGDCPVDMNGNIINTFPTSRSNNVAVGTSTLFYTNSNGHTAIGSESLQFLKHGLQNTAVGYLAGKNLEANVSPTGKVMINFSVAGSYIISNGLITVTHAEHGFSTGDTVKIKFTSGPVNEITSDYLWLTISVYSVNAYTIVAPPTVLSGSGGTSDC